MQMNVDKIVLAFAALIIGTAAEVYGPRDNFGPAGELVEGAARERVENAAQNPTLTRSVPFKPFDRYSDSLSEDSLLRDTEWKWRVNISDMAAPDAENAPEDPHVAVTTYDFSWPGGANISTSLDNAIGQLCLATFRGVFDLPVNVTNAYAEKNTNSTSCEPVLGKDCINAILATPPPDRGTCVVPDLVGWSDIPECAGSFGYAVHSRPQESHTLLGIYNGIVFNASSGDDGESGPMSGVGFYANVTEPLEGSGSRIFSSNANRLHLLFISTQIPIQGRTKPMDVVDLLCMRVNATELPDVDGDGDGVAFTSEVVLEGESMGTRTGHGAICHVLVSMVFTLISVLATV